MNLETEIYQILKKHRLSLNKREELIVDLLDFINKREEAITVTHCCKSDSELLPSFLYKKGGLYFKYREDTDVTEHWNEYLKTR